MPSSYIISGEATSINNITGLGTGVLAGELARPIFATTATAAGTTTLTVTSAVIQEFTGSTTQDVIMPVVTTLVAGWSVTIINNSTGIVTPRSSGINGIVEVLAGETRTLVCRSVSADTTAAAWDVVGQSQPLWLAAQNDAVTASNATETDLTWNPVIGSMSGAITLSGPNTGVFTAPTTGKYTFRTLLQYETSNTAYQPDEGNLIVKLTQSDNTNIKTIRTGGCAYDVTSAYVTGTDCLEWTLSLTAGDTVKARVTYTDGGNGNGLVFLVSTCQLKITKEL